MKIPRAIRRARGPERRPEGPPDCPRDFQNPRRAEGIVGEDYRTKNPNLMHIFFNITNEIYMKNVLGSKIFGVQKNLGVKKIFGGTKIFWAKKFFKGKKNIWG